MVMSKLGPHWLEVTDGHMLAARDARWSVVKFAGQLDKMVKLHEYRAANGLPQPVYIAREWPQDNANDYGVTMSAGGWNPMAAARWFAERADRPEKYQPVRSFAYVELWNEPGFPARGEPLRSRAIRDFVEATIATGDEMIARGYKVVVGNFSVGTPEPDEWATDLLPLLQWISDENATGDHVVLGLHEYGYIWPAHLFGPNQRELYDALTIAPDYDGPPRPPLYDTGGIVRFPDPSLPEGGWLFGRYRKALNAAIRPLGLKVPIVLTEFNISDNAATSEIAPLLRSRGIHVDGWGWQDTVSAYGPMFGIQDDPHGFAMACLAWADTVMAHDPEVLGATMFALGATPTWAAHEIFPLLERITQHVNEYSYIPLPPPGPEPEPEPEPPGEPPAPEPEPEPEPPGEEPQPPDQETSLMDDVIAILNKIRSVLVDRRFYGALAAILGALYTLGLLNSEVSEEQIGTVVEAIAYGIDAIAGLLAVLAPALALLWSWTQRPPSGVAGGK